MSWAEETWSALAALPLQIDEVSRETLRLPLPHLERISTVIVLSGGGHEGRGEDVTYAAEEHPLAWPDDRPPVDATSVSTLGELCAAVGATDLFPAGAPEQASARDFRRWAWEAAALDLALRQSHLSLSALLGKTPQPLRFVSSARVGHPPSSDMILALRAAAPGLQFKLDADGDWDAAFLTELAELDCVAAVDLKAYYVGTVVDVDISPDQVVAIAEALPDATLEDVAPGEATERIAQRWPQRLSWDAPIHRLADLQALPITPRQLNIKPSRIGSIQELLSIYEWVADHGVQAYAGGQFELGVGRGQIMLLASIMHPDAANDCAPAIYHHFEPGARVPASPLPAPDGFVGFRWPGD